MSISADWDGKLLAALKASARSYDDLPDWRAALSLYEGQAASAQAELDAALVRMIDENYRNPHSQREPQPFEGVLAGLPAGMMPDDLLTVEAAVMVAAERGVGEAYFALNELMRAPRWHALFPRLVWLGREAFAAQRKLADTEAGRCAGALLGLALGDALTPGPDGVTVAASGSMSAAVLAVAEQLSDSVAELQAAVDRAGIVVAAVAGEGAPAGKTADLAVQPEAAAVQTYVETLTALLEGRSLREIGSLWQQRSVGGAATGSWATAVWCLGTTSSLEDCLTRAVKLGPEACALAGALAGAHYGPLAAPRRWTAEVRNREPFERAARKLYRIRRAGIH